jgi:hypothetical protein
LIGAWKGNCSKSIFIAQPLEIKVELVLYRDTLITGVSHFTYKQGLYEHYRISGSYSPKDSILTFIEDSVLSIKTVPTATMCKGKYELKFCTVDNKLLLGW